jgi:Ca-activated chloride channel family protein
MNMAHPHMAASSGPAPVLERVKVEGSLQGTLARILMRQTYRNPTDEPLEVIYTFPSPRQSTLLGVEVELAGQRRRGQVFVKAQAEAKYEEAIAAGDTALMVERPEPGLYVMNLGNLMAGEVATVEVEFAMLLDWHRNQLRLSLPMTLAPRYGEERSELEDHQKPASSILVERPFELNLRLSRDFLGAQVSSPTHWLSTQQDDSGIHVRLQRETAWMDRDFVLSVHSTIAPKPFGCVVTDGEQATFYGSLQIPPSNAKAIARDVKVVLDCSGSMGGESIALARSGVLNLLDRLRPEDRFGLVAFGSQPVAWQPRLQGASEDHLEAAASWIRERNADMGGTEMAAALRCAFALGTGKDGCDIFLVTDGQVGEVREVITEATRSGHRVFVVGIGTAPHQDLLSRLAQETGGAAEWVTPGEQVAEAIHRLFTRLVEVPVSDLQITSSSGFVWQALPGAGFSGDTLHVFAGMRDKADAVHIEWRMPDGARHRALLPAAAPVNDLAADLPRVAAGARIRDLSKGNESAQIMAELAVRYGLVTAQTNLLLTIEREGGRATGMPRIYNVDHMMAAGWGATALAVDWALPSFQSSSPTADYSGDITFSRKRVGEIDGISRAMHMIRSVDPGGFAMAANAAYRSIENAQPLELTIAHLRALGLPHSVINRLMLLAGVHSEREVVRAFWALLLNRSQIFTAGRGLRRAAHLARVEKADDALILEIGRWLDQEVGDLIAGEGLGFLSS